VCYIQNVKIKINLTQKEQVINPPNKFLNLKNLRYLPVLVPPLAMFFILVFNAVNVPLYDEWDFMLMLIKAQDGTITFSDLWFHHNEHRMLFLKMLYIILALFSGWNILTVHFASFVFGVLSLFLLTRLLLFTVKNSFTPVLLLVISAFVFSPVQYDSWFWALGIQWFFTVFWAITTLWLLTRWQGTWSSLIVALLPSIAVTYSSASGFVIWIVTGLGMLVHWKKWGWQKIFVWGGAAIVIFGGYFIGWQKEATSGQANPLVLLQKPVEYLVHVVSYLGAPLGLFPGRVVTFCGLSGCLLLIFSTLYIFRSWRKTKTERWEAALVWLQLSLFAVFTGAINGIGRLGLALESRYTTVSILFWIGTSVIFFLAVEEYLENKKYQVSAKRVRLFACLPLLIATFLYVRVYSLSYAQILHFNDTVETALYYLYEREQVPVEVLQYLYIEEKIVLERTRTLDELKGGIYRLPKPDFQKQWRNLLSSDQYTKQLLPFDKISLKKGNVANWRPEATALTFVPNDQAAVSLVTPFNLGKPNDYILFDDAYSQLLNIVSEKATYAIVKWETIDTYGYYGGLKAIAYRLENSDGKKNLVLSLPSNVQSLQIELFYRLPAPASDTVQIEVYTKK
jgi:hypothetical protein